MEIMVGGSPPFDPHRYWILIIRDADRLPVRIIQFFRESKKKQVLSAIQASIESLYMCTHFEDKLKLSENVTSGQS